MKEVKIVLCSACDGWGQKTFRELEDYHQGIYREWVGPCPACHGVGRLKVETKTQPLSEVETKTLPLSEEDD